MRRRFRMPEGDVADVHLSLHHDEDAEVYVDVILAASVTGYNAACEPVDIAPAASAMLAHPGEHVLAVHCRQTTGGQYIDVGIAGYLRRERK